MPQSKEYLVRHAMLIKHWHILPVAKPTALCPIATLARRCSRMPMYNLNQLIVAKPPITYVGRHVFIIWQGADIVKGMLSAYFRIKI
jgi:hypothetical protein